MPLSFSSSWMGMKYTRLVSPIETMAAVAAAWVIPFSQVVVAVPTFLPSSGQIPALLKS